MAAVGLMPDAKILDDGEETAAYYISMLADLVFALKDTLKNINENSYNNFTLRVGEYGPYFRILLVLTIFCLENFY